MTEKKNMLGNMCQYVSDIATDLTIRSLYISSL